jgi:hypothetical protein
MDKLKTGLAVVSVVTAGLFVERLVDPLERHEHNYVLEGPAHRSEVFYVSTNYYDETGKHDDRVGDVILITSMVAGLGAMSLELSRKEIPISTPGNVS